MIRRLKIAIVFATTVLAVACFSSPTIRYSITDSNKYEASLFRQNCAICHGPEAEGREIEPDRLTPNLREGEFKHKTDDQIYNHISEGGNGMVPFKNQLTKREIDMLVRLVQDDLRKR